LFFCLRGMKYGQLVVGPAGSGKSTYCAALMAHCVANGRTVRLVNLDPAADQLNYEAVVDVRELISVDDVLSDKELILGPNGALVFCMEYLVGNVQWLNGQLDAADDDYFVFDCPGQIELYGHLPVMRNLVDALKSWDFNICAVFLLDSQFLLDAFKFLAGALTTLSTMVSLEIPAVNVLTKMDLVSEDRRELIDSFLEADTRTLLEQEPSNQWSEQHRGLTQALASLLDDYSLVKFIPLQLRDDIEEDSLKDVLATIDQAIQYGEDLEVRDRLEEREEDG